MKKKVKNVSRFCPICGHILQRKGKYKFKNSYRWYCPKCHKYIKDNKKKN